MKNNKPLSILIIIVFAILATFFSEDIAPTQEPKKSNIKKDERYYQTKMCTKLGGVMEYRLPDKTRIDCLTDTHAIEVDWAKKWAEGIGQSLYYALQTNRQPAVALIVGHKDEKYLKRINKVAKEFNIKVIVLEKE